LTIGDIIYSSEEEFNEKWYGVFMKLIESNIKDEDDAQLFLENNINDIESWNIEWVRTALLDEWVDEATITLLLWNMSKPTLTISEDTINNLWNVDFAWAVDSYIQTWEIPEGYEYFEKYFNEIWNLIDRQESAKDIIEKINSIKEKMRWLGLNTWTP